METTRFSSGKFTALAVPVLQDNFVYLICRKRQSVLIDAGEAQPIFRVLKEDNLELLKVLITHTHYDHVGGCRALMEHLNTEFLYPDAQMDEFAVLGTHCRLLDTPGHAAVHKCYYFPQPGWLFSGDTLINGACGRVLDGTARQLFTSLRHILALPDKTVVLGGHDYLEENLRFALSVEPGNRNMAERLERYWSRPATAIFATLGEEKKTNPFLRAETLKEFIDLRERRDHF